MSFQQGLSGLSAASQSLDVIGNNVANSSTVGFKESQAQFADVYAASLSGAGSNSVGIGTKLAAVAQQFSKGNITVTNNPLDVAINGTGFFRMSNNGAITYTRNGQFQLDKNGNIVGNTGLIATGYLIKQGVVTGQLGNITIDTGDLSPKITASMDMTANLDSRDTVPAITPFPAALTVATAATPTTPAVYNPPDPTSYNDANPITIYDSLGNAHSAMVYFSKAAAPANTWNVNMTIDNGQNTATAGEVFNMGTMTFDSAGKLASTVPPAAGSDALGTLYVPSANTGVDWDPALGVTSPQKMSVHLGSVTQYGSNFGVTSSTQDGYASGRLSGFSIDPQGMIQGRYTNGKTQVMGQMAVASFTNSQGLKPIGDNQWVESPESGSPIVGKPGSGTMGILQSSAVEESNVDLTQELVNMITAQRFYQANAQTIKTEDQIMQTLVNLR
jgi:flagellar hook protein FlgE